MKRYNHIGTLTAVIAAAVVLLAGCTKNTLTDPQRPLPPAGMGEVTLGELQLIGGDASERAQTRATGASNLPAGATLRLYAFLEGETNFGSKLATRTYTISATGEAQLDAGQEPLYLPVGKADIYLVGPVERNAGSGVEEVASEWGVTPYIGVDLIATYAQTRIVAGDNNPLPAMVLEHKMARTQVVVETNPNGVYENLVVEEVKLYGQPSSGVFTLDQTGGVITAGSTLEDFVCPSVDKDPNANNYSATTVLMPQAQRELKIETTFTCNQKNVEVGDNFPAIRYRQSGLITASLAASAATRFSTAPITPVEIKWRTKVLPWNEVAQDEIYVPGVVQLPPVTNGLVGHYDGRIPPEVINGIMVWRDCSPQQNHGKLIAGTTWDAESGSYVGPVELINEAASYLYSSQNGMTVEMIWKRPHVFNDISIFRIGRPSDPSEKKTNLTSWKPSGAKYCEWTEGTFRRNYLWGESTEEEDVNNFAYWAWAKGGHDKTSEYYNRGYKNGVPQSTGYSTTSKPLAGENLIAFGHNEWKLKSVRIYNRQLSDDEIKLNYEFDKRHHIVPPPPPPPPAEPADSYIPTDVLQAAGWPADKLPARGLQVAMRGDKQLPGSGTAAADDPKMQWKTSNTATAGVESVSSLGEAQFGMGKANTDAMIAAGSALHPAAQYCRDMGPEWYLPSGNEFGIIRNAGTLGEAYSFKGDLYLTSSEFDDGAAYAFMGSMPGGVPKTNLNYVRCVREI